MEGMASGTRERVLEAERALARSGWNPKSWGGRSREEAQEFLGQVDVLSKVPREQRAQRSDVLRAFPNARRGRNAEEMEAETANGVPVVLRFVEGEGWVISADGGPWQPVELGGGGRR